MVKPLDPLWRAGAICVYCMDSQSSLAAAVPASSLASLPVAVPPSSGIDRLLARLNPDQRAAARHGLDGTDGGPLLIIAGAGTGKTNTLAHRVACLVASGVDPRTILLLTFSRRAAVEMTRRVEGIVAGLGEQWARVAHTVLPWAGTFHGVGARLLREYAERCGMDPAFTILDREDAADLMNLVRAELRLNESGERFPLKGTCLAIYSTAVNKQARLDRVLADDFPWCATWEPQLRRLFAAYVEAKQRQGVLDYDDLLLYWAQLMDEPTLAGDVRQRFSHVLVDEYQDTNRLQADDPARAEAGRARAHGRRRRRAGDLRLPRRDRAQHPRLPGALHAAGAHRHARAQLPVDAGHPRRHQRGHRAGQRALHEGPLERARVRRTAAHRRRRRRSRPGALRRRAGAGAARGVDRAEVAGRALPRVEPQRGARTGTRPAQHPVRQVRRTEVPGGRAREGRARVPAAAAEPARSRRRLPRAAVAARRRPEDGVTAPGCDGARRSGGRPRARDAAAGRRGRVGRVRVVVRPAARAARRAGPRSSNSSTSGTSRTCSAGTTTPTSGSATCASSRRSRPAIRRANGSSPN